MSTIQRCPDCGLGGMRVVRETYEARGRWVWYSCRSPHCGGAVKDFVRG